VRVGATPLLADIDEYFTVDVEAAISQLETGRIRAVLPVHLYGQPADMDRLVGAAHTHGIPVVEDASEALGATWTTGPHAGAHVGTLGRIGCFSFNGNKLITTGGGGMLVTDDEALARRARHLSTQARLPGIAYDHDEVGYNYRLTNIAAALGVAQLEQLPALLAGRRELAARYDAAIDEDALPLRPAPRADWADPSYWLYTCRIDPERTDVTLESLLAGLAEAGVDARPMWTPLHRTKLYAGAARIGGGVADSIVEVACSLPSSSTLGAARQRRVTDRLAELLVQGG